MVKGAGYQLIYVNIKKYSKEKFELSETTLRHYVEEDSRPKETLYWKVTDDSEIRKIENASVRWKRYIWSSSDYYIKVQMTASGEYTGCIKIIKKAKISFGSVPEENDWMYFKKKVKQ